MNSKFIMEELRFIVRYIIISDKNKFGVEKSNMLSETERAFLKDLSKNNLKRYSADYRSVLKHRILNKRRRLTEDLLLINFVLDKLEGP
jgi:hypothetical protein